MLGLAVLTQNANTAHTVEVLVEQSGGSNVVFKGSPIPCPRSGPEPLYTYRPEITLLDISDWGAVSRLAHELKDIGTAVVGFGSDWTREQQLAFEHAGIRDLLREPFTFGEMEAAAFEALHRDRPVANQNILAFLPAKAGGGCSTVALNTAAALVTDLEKKVLLLESDRRSGVLSILLNMEDRIGLREALEDAAHLTAVQWQQTRAEIAGLHLLLANPGRRGPLPAWGDYYPAPLFLCRRSTTTSSWTCLRWSTTRPLKSCAPPVAFSSFASRNSLRSSWPNNVVRSWRPAGCRGITFMWWSIVGNATGSRSRTLKLPPDVRFSPPFRTTITTSRTPCFSPG